MAHKRWLVFGAGGHGRVVADAIRRSGDVLAAWADVHAEDLLASGALLGDVPVWEEEFALARVLAQSAGVDGVALGIGANAARLSLLKRLGDAPAPPVIDPSAVVGHAVSLGRGAAILPNSVIGTGTSVGDAVIVNSGAIVEHDSQLADGVHIGPGAVLCGGVRVGRGTLVGAGAVVIPGIEIGADAVIGAGTVVTATVPDGVTLVGVSARRAMRRAPAR